MVVSTFAQAKYGEWIIMVMEIEISLKYEKQRKIFNEKKTWNYDKRSVKGNNNPRASTSFQLCSRKAAAITQPAMNYFRVVLALLLLTIKGKEYEFNEYVG